MKNRKISDDRLDKLLKSLHNQDEREPSNEAIDSLVSKARRMVVCGKVKDRIGFIEFIILQIKIMKKEWWIAQAAALFIAGKLLLISDDQNYTQRWLSIVASLFVILIIPELWKNIENKSIEIEETSFFDLRRVYAAKLIAFGVIDTIILTLFCIYATQIQSILFSDVLKQFVFPIIITSMICMMVFSAKRYFNQTITMIICIAVNIVWMLIVLNEDIYVRITPVVWTIMFSISILLTIYYIRKALYKNIKCLEESFNELNFG